MDKTIAFVCDTPYQVLNAVNYTYHLKTKNNVCVHLYLGKTFIGFQSVYENLRKIHLFDDIFVFAVNTRKNTIAGYLDSVLKACSPHYSLSKYLDGKLTGHNHNYQKIFVNAATKMAIALILVYKDAVVEYYDDGVGSYIKELSLTMLSKNNLLIRKLCRQRINRIVPTKIHLNCPSLASREIQKKALQMPALHSAPKDLLDLIQVVFSYNDDVYYRREKLICLTSINDLGRPGMDAFETSAREIIPKQCTNYLMRLHPRQLTSDYQNCVIDERRDMWELVCSDQITDKHVLLSYYSTAQLTPKMLYDKEPVLIFAFRAYPQGLEESKITDMQESIDRLKNSYRAKDRIIIPQTPDELWKCVEEYCK